MLFEKQEGFYSQIGTNGVLNVIFAGNKIDFCSAYFNLGKRRCIQYKNIVHVLPAFRF